MHSTEFNRRSEKRICLSKLYSSNLSIRECGGQPVETRKKPVVILDISFSGLRFISDLDFPDREDLILSFELGTDSGTVRADGRIVWRKASGPRLYQYGVKLIHKEKLESFFLRSLNELLLSLNPEELRRHELYEMFAYDWNRKGFTGNKRIDCLA
jgi:hypothetical protein